MKHQYVTGETSIYYKSILNYLPGGAEMSMENLCIGRMMVRSSPWNSSSSLVVNCIKNWFQIQRTLQKLMFFSPVIFVRIPTEFVYGVGWFDMCYEKAESNSLFWKESESNSHFLIQCRTSVWLWEMSMECFGILGEIEKLVHPLFWVEASSDCINAWLSGYLSFLQLMVLKVEKY